MADCAKFCSYGDSCKVNPRGPQPSLVACGDRGCDNLLHHLCQGEYEAAHPELDPSEMNKRCLPCLLKPGEMPCPPLAPISLGLTPNGHSPRGRPQFQRRASGGSSRSVQATRASPLIASLSPLPSTPVTQTGSAVSVDDSMIRRLPMESCVHGQPGDDELGEQRAMASSLGPQKRPGRQPCYRYNKHNNLLAI